MQAPAAGTPFEKKEPRGLETLQTILQPLVLRRTKSMRGKDGQPIVTLPDKVADIEYLEFSPAERDFYQAIFTRSKLKFNDYMSSCVHVAPGWRGAGA